MGQSSLLLLILMNSGKLLRYIKGESSLFERIDVCRWALLSEANKSELESLRSIHAALAMTEDIPVIDEDRGQVFKHAFALAAVACALVALFFLPRGVVNETDASENHLYVASEDSNMNIILPDGSTVTLTAGSRLIFSNMENNVRNARLEGECFFEVSHDPDCPFVVDADDLTVTVRGTKFNVNTSDSHVEVMLETGSGKAARV